MKSYLIKTAAAFVIASSALWVQAPEATEINEKKTRKKTADALPTNGGAPNSDGAQNAERSLPSNDANPATPAPALVEQKLPDVIVTASREEEDRRDVPLSVGSLKPETIREVKPVHPSEIFNRVAGVFIATTSGEGHVTSIRQPISSNPYYLYLEDGVPTRATGFFNHNALYEVNIPQAGGVEIIKGPSTALYGSDAVGGVINVLTKPVTRDRELDLSYEYGGFGFKRLMASVGEKTAIGSFRVDGNMTDMKGWRDGTQFGRQSGTLRWDLTDGRDHFKALVSASNINQQSAGIAQVTQSDYDNNPQVNYMQFSYRKIVALRTHLRWDHDFNNMSALSTTVFGRYNEMAQLPNYLGPSPFGQNENNLRSASAGLMLKHDQRFNWFSSKLITGADFDFSPGAYKEWGLSTTKSGNYFNTYTTGAMRYDYNAAFYQASPYAQFESSPFTEKLHVNLGLRYDHMGYMYADNMSTAPQSASYYRPGATSPTFDHLSPKAGLVYDVADALNVFTSYRHGYRVPSQGDLFRSGSITNSVGLQPIKADSYELGMRGNAFKERLKYEITGYYMIKTDDLVSYLNPDGTTSRINAGRTLHKGIEFGLEGELWKKFVWLSTNLTYAEHTYSSYTSPLNGVNFVYDGNFIAQAPTVMSTSDLKVRPLNGLQIELEWVFLGRYFMDDANTVTYPGHNLFNVRARYELNERFTVFARLHNLTNVRYSDFSSYTPTNTLGPMYTPGEPLSLICGLSYSL